MFETPKVVVLDFETTSLSENREATEIGLVALDFELNEMARYETLLNPHVAPNPEALKFSGLTLEDLIDAPRASEVWPNFAHFFSKSVMVMHNQIFDRLVIKNSFVESGLLRQIPPSICTLELSRQIVGGATGGSHKLEAMCSYFGIINKDAHTALSDALATAELLRRLTQLNKSILDDLSYKAHHANILQAPMESSFQASTRFKGRQPLPVASGVVTNKQDLELTAIASEILNNPAVEYVNVTGDLTLPFSEFDTLLRQVGLYYKETPTTKKTAFTVVGHRKTGGSKIAKAQEYRRPILLETDALRMISILKRLRNL